ncbi:hypothetical protein [Flavobacterium psychrophilum]|uniref:hypothetical protein n=1 Tax=Flavobacterium psychrophilum TaxID=96345 RepID=UPI00106A2BBF|nr:hypothetical protein [Flavobacterium psychrophilum]
MRKVIAISLIFTFLISCNQKGETQKELFNTKNLIKKDSSKVSSNPTEEKIENNDFDKPKEWLKNIFKCKNSDNNCFYLEKEKQVCTKKFYEFMIDSEELYGASNLTEEEYPNALKKYKKKWSGIYTLRDENTGEAWLFGRGQDDMENIKVVEIKKISDFNYSVFIDFGNNLKTQSMLIIVAENNEYKIDYCKTEFIE